MTPILTSIARKADTRVSYRLEPDGGGTRVFFEHSSLDITTGETEYRGAEYGWKFMHERLETAVSNIAARK